MRTRERKRGRVKEGGMAARERTEYSIFANRSPRLLAYQPAVVIPTVKLAFPNLLMHYCIIM